MAQLDFGGVPFENVMKNIELIGNDIIPAIKKHLSKSGGRHQWNIVLLSGSTVGSKTRIAMDDLKNELEVINEGHQIALMDLRDLEL